jgi:hypothetical protein
MGPGIILTILGGLGLYTLFTSGKSAASSKAPDPTPVGRGGKYVRSCGPDLCVFTQQVRPGTFEVFADRFDSADQIFATAQDAVTAAEFPIVTYSEKDGKRTLQSFDPNNPDTVETVAKMLGI